MTALADLVSDRDRRRLLEHLDQAGGLDRLMREPGTLAGPGEPEPLHRTGRDTTTLNANSSTTLVAKNSTKFSTSERATRS